MLKYKSLEELKDCLDVIHQQLQDVFYSNNPNPKHILKLSKWFDDVALEIDFRMLKCELSYNNTKHQDDTLILKHPG